MRDHGLDGAEGDYEQDPLGPDVGVVRESGGACLGCEREVAALDELADVSAGRGLGIRVELTGLGF